MAPNPIYMFFGWLIVFLLIWLIMREVICWYYKINKNMKLKEESLKKQDEIIRLLKSIVGETEHIQQDNNPK